MNNIKIILSDTYPIVILSILSYICFRIISRIFNKNKINIREHKVPWEIVLQIFAAIAVAKFPTIKVTIINIDDEVNIVWIDLLYALIIDSFTSRLFRDSL